MKKDAIIDMLQADLREMLTLVETFREPDSIAKDFIDLLIQKHDGVGREVRLLNYWATENLIRENQAIELSADVRVGSQPSAPSSNATSATEDKKPEPQQPQMAPQMHTVVASHEESPTESQLHPSKAPKVAPQVAPESATKAPRAEVPDYFASELDDMPDPVESLAASFAASFGAVKNGTQEVQEPAAAKQTEVTAATQVSLSAQPKVTAEISDQDIPPATAASAAQEVPMTQESPSVADTPATPVPPAATQPQVTHASAVDITTYGKPVDDFNKAIGINDSYLFLRELFGGNKMAFQAAIETVNAAGSFDKAQQYFRSTYHWDETSPIVEAFYKAVHRRFLQP
ncbi:MAG: hypothetical protein SPE05_05230 [Bacteroidales bacterium]|nr:hypothetical protein [Bacteroidales bacterium]